MKKLIGICSILFLATISTGAAIAGDTFDDEPFPEDGIKRVGAAFPQRCLDKMEFDWTYEVEVEFDVAEDGSTENVKVIKSDLRCFNTNSVRAVEKWRYDPEAFDLPLKGETTKITFRLG